jgi:fermentation-respiration switch protein FrsA (DUF1100 family)
MSVTATQPAPVLAPVRRPAVRLRFVLWVAAGLVVLLGVVRWTSVMERIAFIHPGTTAYATPPGYEDVSFTTPDGMTLRGWFMPAKNRPEGAGPGPAVLHCHGNEGDIAAHASTSAYITQAGVSIFLFDYRGFGRSTPATMLTRDDLLTDAEAAYAYLRTRKDVDPARIGVFGYSLGGTYALELAAKHPEVRCVASVAAFCSWPCVASDYVPVVGRILIPSGLAAEDAAAKLGTRPLLLVHGDRDEIVAYWHGKQILAMATAAHVHAELMTVAGAKHLNIFKPDVKAKIREFFADKLNGQR